MNLIKQALTHYIRDVKFSILLGLAGLLIFHLSRVTPYLGSLLLSLGILFLKDLTQKPLTFQFRHHLLSYLATAIMLVPTIVLMGSALGIMESPQSFFMKAPFSLSLLSLSVFVYFVLSHSLQFHIKSKMALPIAIDKISLQAMKSYRSYLIASIFMGILLITTTFTREVTLILSLPLLIYIDKASYQEP